MATKAATFAAKVRSLQESCNRITSGAFPQPSATDIISTLKFFSQALLSVLKDVSSMSMEVIRAPEKDHQRTSTFPSLDYTGLYNSLVQLLEILPQLQTGIQTVGQTLLHTLSCLVPFLEHEYMDTLPYIVASSMAILPSALHKDLLDMLCYTLLPSTIMDKSGFDNQNYTNISVSAIMMMVFFYTDSPSYYTQLTETLMKLKEDVVKDLFCVIAHGTVKARCPAVELLFQYWPELNPSPLDRKFLSEKHMSWSPLACQHENCASSMSKEAVKMCLDHTIAISSGDRPPPLLVCIECADQIHKTQGHPTLVDILLPLEDISYTCVNQSCKASIAQKIAVSTCFSGECVSFNCNRPVRYCALCDQLKHSTAEGEKHVVHRTISSPWKMDPETQSYFVEAIVNLLKEAQPISDKPGKDTLSPSQSSNKLAGTYPLPTDESNGNMALEERQLLSRYGVWLIISLCTPNDDTPEEVLGRMLSMLFQWFHYTACLPDDQAGSALERLKGECIQGWLMKVMKSHFRIFSNCLLPHPADYARVGGHWDSWPSQTNQIKEGFKRLLCLVPYDIITANVWSHIMPYWMECFRHEVPEQELAELKILLSKVLDPDLSPLGLDPKQMYEFISIRFNNTTAQIQEQALYWIQILTMLEVPVPLKLLLSMFDSGLKSLSVQDRHEVPYAPINKVSTHQFTLPGETNKIKVSGDQLSSASITVGPDSSGGQPPINDNKLNLTCYILMLDILIKQMELQDVNAHRGLENNDALPVLKLLFNILKAPWYGAHKCDKVKDYSLINERKEAQPVQCNYCEITAIWYQLALIMMEYFCPVMEATMIDMAFETSKPLSSMAKVNIFGTQSEGDSQTSDAIEGDRQGDNNVPRSSHTEDHSVGSDHLMEVSSSETSASKVPASDTSSIHRGSGRDGEEKGSLETSVDQKENNEYWSTSQGKFRIEFEKLPIQLQLLHILLEQISSQNDADVLYHIIYIVKLMALHSEVLNKAAKDNRGYLIWCQENLLIPNLWLLLQAEFSQISRLCVPLLMHCVTLPSGREMFLKLAESDFQDKDWRKRFVTVERVTMIAHFLESSVVKNSPSLQTSLTNAFCYLVQCLDDIESAVAQRALLNLESIKTSSLKLLVWCLESQFDMVVWDRSIILQTIFQLYNHLSARRFLTWDFFLNRFDALFLEAQVILERIGDISYTRDLKNTNVNSEVYQKKLARAQEALSHVHLARSLCLSLAGKIPHLRSLTLAEIKTRIAKQQQQLEARANQRQMAATAHRRKSSRFTGNAVIPDKFRHLPNNFFTDNQLREVVQEESHIMHVVHKILEFEEQDRDTMHSLIFLLMQFLSRPDHSHPMEEKTMARNQQIVLRHLNILLGFSPSERNFLVSAANLRNFPVFNAVITSMPKVLDFNFKMGTMMLSTFLPLLVYSPSPLKQTSDLNKKPFYSLWLLQPHIRQSWLMSVMIIMYKYTYTNAPVSKQVELLIRIVMNTLEAQFHRCQLLRHHISPQPLRSRDMSATSMDYGFQAEQDMDASIKTEEETPGSAQGESSEESLEEDGEEPELGVILESPKSENSDASSPGGLTMVISKPFPPPNVSKEEAVKNLEDQREKEEGSNLAESDSLCKVFSDSQPMDISIQPLETKKDSIDSPHSSSREMVNESFQKSFSLEEKTMDEDDISEPSVSESREFEITIAADPCGPASITEKMTSDEKRRTKGGIKKVLETFSEEQNTSTSAKSQQLEKLDRKSVEDSSSVPQRMATGIWAFDPNKTNESVSLLPSKPPPERLLPVGPIARPSNRRFAPVGGFNSYRPIDYSSRSSPTDGLPLPPNERLLPIGPPPVPKNQNAYFGRRFISRLDYAESRAIEPQNQFTVDEKADDPVKTLVNKDVEPTVPSPQEEILRCTEEKPVTSVSAMETFTPDVPNQPAKEVSILINSKTEECVVQMDLSEIDQDNQIEKTVIQDTSEKAAEQNVSQASSSDKVVEQPVKPRRHPPLHSGKSSLEQSISIDMPEDLPPLPEDELIEVKVSPNKQDGTISAGGEPTDETRARPVYKPKRKRRPTGQSDSGVAANVQRRARKAEGTSNQSGLPPKRSSTSQSSLIFGEESTGEKCPNCGGILEEFTEEEIGMCIVILGTFVHREPGLSASLLPEMLKLVSKFTLYIPYPWQHENVNIHLQGCASTIAQQFFRCVFHQLSSNGIFQQIFNSHFPDNEFFKAMAVSLTEFMEMNQVTPLVDLFQNMNEKKHLPPKAQLLHILSNAAHYMECVSLEAISPQAWNSFLSVFETFLRKMAFFLPSPGEVFPLSSIIRMILITLKLSIINNHRTLLDIYSKFVSHSIQQSPLEYEQLLEICHHAGRIFSKDRDRYILTRTIIFELIQAIKFKTFVPDENLMMLLQFILQDLGGTLVPSVVTEHLKPNSDPSIEQYNTNACECIKQYVTDITEFISDVHTISRIKSTFLGTCIHLNEETLGGHLKAGLSQILALEITKSNGRDHRAVVKYLPWLYSLPSVQQGPKEFLDCVAHIRILSWILLGSLQHSALLQHNSRFSLSQPIPLEANGHIAEHIQVILAGFAEQSKTSVIHMSSLFHAFILCQLWTMYCENLSAQNPPGSEQYHQCTLTLSDFWAKITPGILQLVCHSKLAEMVSLHFLSLMEAFMECNSNMLARLRPMWIPVFRSYEGQLSGHLRVRFQTCIDWQPPVLRSDDADPHTYPPPMLRWLMKLQFKMGQIENQSSAAIQFYCM
ncbi:UNC-79 domain-containing protein isoform X2 [Brevipalpus obovatus]|uniref:UNC-79 domain-containing protein isoform X2 n=1 Tax=Brevipalpus obovatus TaxID=246614 RepID=UPI003D9F3342